ncbi:unnamed protein product [Somion occarium]|uniref:DUF6534 domain-containing protein n=1 Tax=Somion occarium TaxID=3059160 RepID=A0ABP1DXI4_9APHY
MASIPALEGGLIECYGLGCILYGIAVTQAYVYFLSCKNDPQWIKWMAGTVISLETVHTAFFLRQLYFYSVGVIADSGNLSNVDWSVPVCLLVEIIIEFIAEGFYIHRLWIFSKNAYLIFVMVLILLGRHGTFLFLAFHTLLLPTFMQAIVPAMKANFIATLCLLVALEGILASAMVYYLHQNRGRFKRTHSVVNWLIRYYVNTGAILVVLAIILLIIYLVLSNSLLYVGITNIFAKSIANSLLGAHLLRSKMHEPVIIGTSVFASNTETRGYEMHDLQVEVTQEISKRSDHMVADTTKSDVPSATLSVDDEAYKNTSIV